MCGACKYNLYNNVPSAHAVDCPERQERSMNAYDNISRLSDAVVPTLNRLAEDPEGEYPRRIACEAIEALHASIADLTTREDISIMPRCPVGLLTAEAIMGRLPYAVTPDLCRRWVKDLDRWAGEIDKIAATL